MVKKSADKYIHKQQTIINISNMTQRKLIILENKRDALVINEDANANVPAGCMLLRGPLAVCDVRNDNNRIYERAEYQKHVDRLQPSINEGLLGEFNHPKHMNTGLNENTAVKIQKVEIMEDGTVMGDILVLDTPKGQLVQSAAKAGIPVRMSSRGYGSVSESGHVTLERLVTYDVVGTAGFGKMTNMKPVTESFEGDEGEVLVEAYVYDLNEDSDRGSATPSFDKLAYKQEIVSEVMTSVDDFIKQSIKESEQRTQLRIIESCKKTASSLSDWAENNVITEGAVDKDQLTTEVLTIVAEKFGPLIETAISEAQLDTVTKIGPVIETAINETQLDTVTKIGPVIETAISEAQLDTVTKIGPVIETAISEAQIDTVNKIGPVIENAINEVQLETVTKIGPIIENAITEAQVTTETKLTNVIQENAVNIDKSKGSRQINEDLEEQTAGSKSVLEQIDEQINNATSAVNRDSVKKNMKSIFEDSNIPALQMIPESYKVKWIALSPYMKGSILKKASLYEFKNELIAEKFWDSVFEMPMYQATPNARTVNERRTGSSKLKSTLSMLHS